MVDTEFKFEGQIYGYAPAFYLYRFLWFNEICIYKTFFVQPVFVRSSGNLLDMYYLNSRGIGASQIWHEWVSDSNLIRLTSILTGVFLGMDSASDTVGEACFWVVPASAAVGVETFVFRFGRMSLLSKFFMHFRMKICWFLASHPFDCILTDGDLSGNIHRIPNSFISFFFIS